MRRAKCSSPRILSSVCAPKDVEERKGEWDLDVEPPAVRENSADRCAGSSADHVAANVFHLAAARRKRACRLDGERLLQRRKVVTGSERRRAGKRHGFGCQCVPVDARELRPELVAIGVETHPMRQRLPSHVREAETVGNECLPVFRPEIAVGARGFGDRVLAAENGAFNAAADEGHCVVVADDRWAGEAPRNSGLRVLKLLLKNGREVSSCAEGSRSSPPSFTTVPIRWVSQLASSDSARSVLQLPVPRRARNLRLPTQPSFEHRELGASPRVNRLAKTSRRDRLAIWRALSAPPR